MRKHRHTNASVDEHGEMVIKDQARRTIDISSLCNELRFQLKFYTGYAINERNKIFLIFSFDYHLEIRHIMSSYTSLLGFNWVTW